MGEKNNREYSLSNPEITPAKVAEELKSKGFYYAALYLEDPEVADKIRLSDIILRLNDHRILYELILKDNTSERGHERDFIYKTDIGSFFKDKDSDIITTSEGKDIAIEKIPSITIQAANHVAQILPKLKPLSLEDAYLMNSMVRRNTNHLKKHGTQLTIDPAREACRFFHAVFFYTPFPPGRDPKEFYKDPIELIENTIAKEQETPENFVFAKNIMEKLVHFFNEELLRRDLSDKMYREKNPTEEEKNRIAPKIKLDLRGFREKSYLPHGEEPQPYPSERFGFHFGYFNDVWIRFYGWAEVLNALRSIRILSTMDHTDFGVRLSQCFRNILKENPLDKYYLQSPYLKGVFEKQ